MGFRAWKSNYNRFVLAAVVVLVPLGVYAVFSKSQKTQDYLGVLFTIFMALVIGSSTLWLWHRNLWSKLIAVSSWLCILFAGSVLVSGFMEWSHGWSPESVDMMHAVICAVIYLLLVTDCQWLLRLQLQRMVDRWLRAASVVLAIVFGALIILANETDWMKELLGQVREEQVMLNLFMTVVASQVVVAILASIGKERAAKLTRKHLGGFMLQFNCPRCGAANRLPTGGATCSACHLEIHIEFDEPRCECGYMLHKLTGINCPECGKVVPEKLRWNSAVSTASMDPTMETRLPIGT